MKNVLEVQIAQTTQDHASMDACLASDSERFGRFGPMISCPWKGVSRTTNSMAILASLGHRPQKGKFFQIYSVESG
jgi:hypothetical protein